MKFKKFLAFLGVALLGMPLASCGTNNTNSNPSIPNITENGDVNKQIHDIYKLAKENGYQGTYEQWLASIKGDPGVGIVDIEISQPDEDGFISITIKLTDGTEKIVTYNVDHLKGEPGDPGQPGHDGVDGSTIRTGAGRPHDSLGNNDDIYLDTSTFDIYKKDTGRWVLIGNLKGADGQDGQDGQDGHDGNDGTNGQNGTNGTNGSDGKDGTNGSDGKDGKDGTSFLTGDGRPSNDIGNIGDVYLDLSSSNLWKKKETGWIVIALIKGEPGEQGSAGVDGTNGTSFITGTGIPSEVIGNEGDTYLDITNSDLYSKTENGWKKIGNIKGKDGADGQDGKPGDNGANGIDGVDGQSMLHGKGKPSLNLGKHGDLYLDKDTFDLYEKTEAGWIKVGNIKGTSEGESKPDQGGGNTNPGKSAYELYVENFGYVGTEKEWLTDLAHNQLGTEKEYTVGIYRNIMGQETPNGKPLLEEIVAPKTYKNGETVPITLPDPHPALKYIGACDNYDEERDQYINPKYIDITSYRAYKNCKIVLGYDTVHYSVIDDQGNLVEEKAYDSKSPVTITLGNRDPNSGTIVLADPTIFNNLTYRVENIDNPSVTVSFDNKTRQISVSGDCQFTFALYMDGIRVASAYFRFETSTGGHYQFDPKFKEKVASAAIGDQVSLAGIYIDEKGQKINTAELFASGELSFYIEEKDPSNPSIEPGQAAGTIIILAPGFCVLNVVDSNKNTVWTGQLETCVNQNPGPDVNPPTPDVKLELRVETNGPCYANRFYKIRLIDATHNVDLSTEKIILKAFDFKTKVEYYGLAFDPQTSSFSIKDPGTYILRAELEKRSIDTMVVVDKASTNPGGDIPEPGIIDYFTLDNVVAEKDNLQSKLYKLEVRVDSIQGDFIKPDGDNLRVSGLSGKDPTQVMCCSTLPNSFVWNGNGYYNFTSDHKMDINPVTNKMVVGDRLTVLAMRSDKGPDTVPTLYLQIIAVNKISVDSYENQKPVYTVIKDCQTREPVLDGFKNVQTYDFALGAGYTNVDTYNHILNIDEYFAACETDQSNPLKVSGTNLCKGNPDTYGPTFAQKNQGILKAGAKGKCGEITIDTGRNISRVAILAAGWSAQDKISINKCLPIEIEATRSDGQPVWMVFEIPTDSIVYISIAYRAVISKIAVYE